VRINRLRTDNWLDVRLSTADVVELYTTAGDFIFAPIVVFGVQTSLAQIASIVAAVISVTSFIVSLVTAPKSPKQRGSGTSGSNTYSWDGMHTGVSPGNPVAVIYGYHRTPGQLLSMFIDVGDSGRRQQLNMLIGLGEGPISGINTVQINDIPVEQFEGVSV